MSSAPSPWKALSGWLGIRKRKEMESKDPGDSSPPPSAKRLRPEPRITFPSPRHVFDYVKDQTRSSPIRSKLGRGSRVASNRVSGFKPTKINFDEPPPPGRLPVIPLGESGGGAKPPGQENIPPVFMFTGNPQYRFYLDQKGFQFVAQCIEFVEKNGLDQMGLYRVDGSRTKVSAFLQRVFSEVSQNVEQPDLHISTVSSALKVYFRSLPEPLLPVRLHKILLTAANNVNKPEGVKQIFLLIRSIPDANARMLALIIPHLARVAGNAGKNQMNITNLSVCWGPTLLRAEAETVEEIKAYNVVIELLVEYWQQVFG